MVRGVNRMTVEVSSTDSRYFERAICFVRPQYVGREQTELRHAAEELLSRLDYEMEDEDCPRERKKRKAPDILPRLAALTAAALAGAAAGAAAVYF